MSLRELSRLRNCADFFKHGAICVCGVLVQLVHASINYHSMTL